VSPNDTPLDAYIECHMCTLFATAISLLSVMGKRKKKKALTYHAGCVHLGACMLCSHMYVHSGRHGNENFPGFGNRPPLVIEGDCAYVRWQTDGSNEDWGWRFTATAQFK
jgi:hypothetical protein